MSRRLAEGTQETRIFEKQGETWLVVFDGIPKSVRDMRGMHHIHQLLQNPWKKLHAAFLRSVVAGETEVAILGSAGKMHDKNALGEYRDRIVEIDEELAEAEANNDQARMAPLSKERAVLLDYIGGRTGLYGRSREASSDRKRARQSVSAAIHRALRKIKKEHPPLWQHLQRSLKTGEFLLYAPDPPISWRI